MNRSAEQFCSLLSTAAGEPLIGSAGKTNVFFLLEYNGVWESKAFEKSAIPEAVKQQLDSFAKSLPAAKTLLIKQSSQARHRSIHFYIALTDENDPRLYLFELSSYEELLDLNLEGVLQGDERHAGRLQTAPLYLVCTNGRRDACCARFGFQVYEALKKTVGEAAWECSHLGGHRFASNVFHMPYGVLYGRVQPQDVKALAEQMQAGQIHLENLRGRAAYLPSVQAAEYYLRRESGELTLGTYRLKEAIETEPGRWRINFIAAATGAERRLEIMAEQSSEQVFESCTLDKSTRMVRYLLA
jgi:hypothetical protein